MKTMLIVDGNSVLNRAFYGVRPLTTHSGQPTNALFGMVSILLRHLHDIAPDYGAVAYDLPVPTFRHERYAAYKAGRHRMPDELAAQLELSKECCRALGFRVCAMPGYEADDLLGTYAAMGAAAGMETLILTGDRDSLQLIGDHVSVLLAGNSDTVRYDAAAFTAKYGVRPDQFVDVKALMGDSSDNIPGVPGIGEKTAVKLIAQYGSLDGVYASDLAAVGKAAREKLTAGKESAYLSQMLAQIKTDVPVSETMETLTYQGMDRNALYALFTRLEFTGFIRKLGLTADGSAVSEAAAGGESAQAEVPMPEAAAGGESAQAEVPMPEAAAGGESAQAEASMPGAAAGGESAQAEVPMPEAAAPVSERWRTISCADLVSLHAGLYGMVCAENVLTLWGEHGGFEAAFADPAALADFFGRSDLTLSLYDIKTYLHRLPDACTIRSAVFDVMLAGYLADANQSSYTVERLAVAYLQTMPDGTPREEARMLYLLCGEMKRGLARDGQAALYDEIELPLAQVLYEMEKTGFLVDREGLLDFSRQLGETAAQTAAAIYDEAGRDFNINSPKQLGEVLFEDLGLPAPKKTKTGYSTSAEVLEKLRPYHPIIDQIFAYRQVTKLKSTYADGLAAAADAGGRVHTSFKQTVTATGRLSSVEPNLQNIPIRQELGRELRRFFVAAPGCVLIDADYSQIELRLLAAVSGDEHMIAAFREGADIHTMTASQVFGVAPDDVTPEQRKRAKAVNFGIVYGIGDFSLAADLHVPKSEAAAYIRSYKDRYPGVESYLSETVRFAREHGYVETLFGRRRYIPELSAQKKMLQAFGERVAMNSPIQGTAADIIKLAMIRVAAALRREQLDARLILQVHDELIVEASAACADRAGEILRYEMEHVTELPVPLTVEVEIGENWYF